MQRMNDDTAARLFAALGNPTRLTVLRLLVQAAPLGLTVGDIQSRLSVPASTLAHHLMKMESIGIIVQKKQGREIMNSIKFEVLQALSDHLLKDCCAGLAEVQ